MDDGEIPLTVAEYAGRPCREQNQGPVTEEEAVFLYGLAIALRPRCIAEVGTGWLRSLRSFYEARVYLKALGWDCSVWSCDINAGVVDKAKATFPGCNVVLGNSETMAPLITVAPELVFIDGEHTTAAVERDLSELRKVSLPETVYVLHDPGIIRDIQGIADKRGFLTLPSPRGIAIGRLL